MNGVCAFAMLKHLYVSVCHRFRRGIFRRVLMMQEVVIVRMNLF